MTSYSVKQIKFMLDVSEEQIRRWIRNGDLKGGRESKKRGYRVKESDFNDFMNRNPKYRILHPIGQPKDDKQRVIRELENTLYTLRDTIRQLNYDYVTLENTIIRLKEES